MPLKYANPCCPELRCYYWLLAILCSVQSLFGPSVVPVWSDSIGQYGCINIRQALTVNLSVISVISVGLWDIPRVRSCLRHVHPVLCLVCSTRNRSPVTSRDECAYIRMATFLGLLTTWRNTFLDCQGVCYCVGFNRSIKLSWLYHTTFYWRLTSHEWK